MFPSDSDFEAKFKLEGEENGVIEELPFHILVFGDWTGDSEKIDLSLRKPIEIDRDNFDEVLRKMRISLEIDLKDCAPIKLEFEELDDFHPDKLYRQVSLFADLRDLRRRLVNPDSFNSAAHEVRDWFNAPDSSDSLLPDDAQNNEFSYSDNILEQILSESSTAVKSQASQKSELGNLIGDLVKPYLISVDLVEQSKLISAVDEAVSELMRQILHHRKFQKLEASWRGLYFLVKNVQTKSDLKIYILNVSKEELGDNLKSVSNLQDSNVYRWMISDKAENFGEDSWSVFCADYAFGATVDDAALLLRLAKLAKLANAPFISHSLPDFLGVKSIAEHPNYQDWNFSTANQELKLWSAIRVMPESEYIGLTIPRFLVRLPYGAKTESIESFNFEEFFDIPPHDQYLWSNSSFLCGLLLAQSFSDNGWEMGNNLKQDISDLPVHIYTFEGETVMKPGSEIVFTQVSCEKLMELGLIIAISYKNTERIRLSRFQSITDPLTPLMGKWIRNSRI